MSYREKGNRPLCRQDIIDILLAANAAHFDLTNGMIEVKARGKRAQTLGLTPHNFMNEVYGRLQRAWFDPDPIGETQRMGRDA